HFLGNAAERPCTLTTTCQAPAGSGLGGSSALGIALAAALNRFTSRGLGPLDLLAVTRAIETQVLRIPTGEQDCHPAVHGGALALNYTVEGTRVERLAVDLEALRQRGVLVYTVSRSSGISNWDMLKRHLDGDAGVRAALDGILAATRTMRRALPAGGLGGPGGARAAQGQAREDVSGGHEGGDRRSDRRLTLRGRPGGEGVRRRGRGVRHPVGRRRAQGGGRLRGRPPGGEGARRPLRRRGAPGDGFVKALSR